MPEQDGGPGGVSAGHASLVAALSLVVGLGSLVMGSSWGTTVVRAAMCVPVAVLVVRFFYVAGQAGITDLTDAVPRGPRLLILVLSLVWTIPLILLDVGLDLSAGTRRVLVTTSFLLLGAMLVGLNLAVDHARRLSH